MRYLENKVFKIHIHASNPKIKHSMRHTSPMPTWIWMPQILNILSSFLCVIIHEILFFTMSFVGAQIIGTWVASCVRVLGELDSYLPTKILSLLPI